MKRMLIFLLAMCGSLPAAVAANPSVFTYRRGTFESSMTLQSQDDAYRVYAVRYPSPMITAFATDNTVYGLFYLPKSKSPVRKPAVIVLHTLGGPNDVTLLLAAYLARHGIAALHLDMPFYGPRSDGVHHFLSTNVDLTVQNIKQAVMDIRRGAGWLADQPEINPARIGIAGVSLGATLASVSFCVDPRFRAGVLILSGGNLAKGLVANGLMASRRRMKALGLNYAFLSKKLAVVDPLTYAPLGAKRRADLLMFNARQDEIVLPACANALWRALGKPRRYWLYGGHYSTMIYLPDILDKTTKFFQRKFSP